MILVLMSVMVEEVIDLEDDFSDEELSEVKVDFALKVVFESNEVFSEAVVLSEEIFFGTEEVVSDEDISVLALDEVFSVIDIGGSRLRIEKPSSVMSRFPS